MMKIKIELTLTEAKAAMVACSNYTPRGGKWQQTAQSRAVSTLTRAIENHKLKTSLEA